MAKRELTEEQKAVLLANLAKGREARAAKRASVGEGGGEASEPAAGVGAPFLPPDQPPAPVDLPGLSDDERRRIQAEARAQIEQELAVRAREERKQLIAKELEVEIQRQRAEAGLIGPADELVTFQINVAPFADALVINGVKYQHGQWVTKPRREYDSFREIMARSWESEDRAGNPNKKFEQERRLLATGNPMWREQRQADGSFTVGLDTRVNSRTGGVINAPVVGI